MFPVPTVKDVTFDDPSVDVLKVNPPPGLDMVYVVGYRNITIPDPPFPAVASEQPEPPPVFVVPETEGAGPL
jgi:hypothetical protein